jgi:hypothetical protein
MCILLHVIVDRSGSECGAELATFVMGYTPCASHVTYPHSDVRPTNYMHHIHLLQSLFSLLMGFPQTLGSCIRIGSAYHIRWNLMPKKSNIPESDPTEASRIVLPLTSDGKINWDKVRSSQREQFLSVVNDDIITLEHIGMSHDSSGSDNEEEGNEGLKLTTENVGALIDTFNKANTIVFRMVAPLVIPHPIKSRMARKRVPLVIDTDIALSAFTLSEEQHKELDPRALRLAKKYMPEAAKKHLDVYMLLMMYLKYTGENCVSAITKQVNRDIEKMKAEVVQQTAPLNQSPAPPPPPPVQPINGHDVSKQQPGSTNDDEEGESLEPGAEPVV